MDCARCHCKGAFLRIRSVPDGSLHGIRLCECCESDLASMGWTAEDYRCARLNRETVQVHNAHKAAGLSR